MVSRHLRCSWALNSDERWSFSIFNLLLHRERQREEGERGRQRITYTSRPIFCWHSQTGLASTHTYTHTLLLFYLYDISLKQKGQIQTGFWWVPHLLCSTHNSSSNTHFPCHLKRHEANWTFFFIALNAQMFWVFPCSTPWPQFPLDYMD